MQKKTVTVKIEPTCRYDHGPLRLVPADDPSENNLWQMDSHKDLQSFSGNLYVCLTCGYIEFFDNDIEATRRDLGVKE